MRLGLVMSVLGCSSASDAEPNAQVGPRKHAEPEPEPIKPAVLVFAQVLERHPSIDALLDFVDADAQARGRFDGVRVVDRGRDESQGRALLGADRAALADYLETVFTRRPELRPPPEIGLAFGPAPRLATPGASVPACAYWLDPTQQLRVTQLVRATVVEDGLGSTSVEVALQASDREAFGTLTEKSLGHEIAIVVDDEVLSAPRVNEAITGGVLRISLADPSTEEGAAEASALARRLRGGTDPATPATPATP